MIEFLMDADLTVQDKLYIVFAPIIFRYKRLVCWLSGCDIRHWSENEYISGWDCLRCGAGHSVVEGDTPFEMFDESLFTRLRERFGIE